MAQLNTSHRTVKMEANDHLSFWGGVKDCVPTLLGYLSIGFAAGVVEKTAGLSLAEIGLLSLLLYAGSAQFIFAGMFAAGSPGFSIIFTVFFVNLRHLLMSAALSPYFRNYASIKNVFLGSQMTDETFAVAISRLAGSHRNNDKWMFGLNITAHVNWIAANLAGGYFGSRIPSAEQYGLDFALPAMFVGLLVLQLISRNNIGRDLLIVSLAVAAFIVFSLAVSGYVAVVAATLFAAGTGMVMDRWK